MKIIQSRRAKSKTAGLAPDGLAIIKIQELAADQTAVVVAPAPAVIRVIITVRFVVVIARRGRGSDTETQDAESDRRADPAVMVVAPTNISGCRGHSLADRLIIRGNRQCERRRRGAEQKRTGHASRKQLAQILTHDPLPFCSLSPIANSQAESASRNRANSHA